MRATQLSTDKVELRRNKVPDARVKENLALFVMGYQCNSMYACPERPSHRCRFNPAGSGHSSNICCCQTARAAGAPALRANRP
jgi:hypothetical protein